jgi:hypothetical protein
MINILSLRCSLAFAPYLLGSLESFFATGDSPSLVIRQAANGLIIRSEGPLFLRHQNREAVLQQGDAEHYFATISLRQEVFDVVRTSDEVVFASLGTQLLLSHPQSEMWFEARAISTLLEAFHRAVPANHESLPDWLTLSGGEGRLLLSDQRNGRWVLLGSDHFAELERRVDLLKSTTVIQQAEKVPTINLKGLKIRLQAANRFCDTLEEFARTGTFQSYEELAPTYQLVVMRAVEGMKISDGNVTVAMTAKEASKWTAILKAEIEKYQVRQSERQGIRTVFADVEQGHWILQWGDEVFVSKDELKQMQAPQIQQSMKERLASKRDHAFLMLLDKASSDCIALTNEEVVRYFNV